MKKIKNSNGMPAEKSPKKSLGQNFLRDPKILKKIVDFAQIEKTDTVVEVGPGEGTLTKLILEKVEKVIAIEKDERMVEFLNEKFKSEIESSKLQIIYGDALEIENLLKNAKLEIENYVLIGNIPYYITGALFKKALESENRPKSLTFVVQKEVAERIMARPSHKATAGKARDGKESILSISIKAYGEAYYGGIIKAGSFYPAPKVDSAIIAVREISVEKLKHINIQTFFHILKMGFAHKRKLLIRNLSRTGLDTLEMKEVFKKCGLSEKVRAEDLKVEDWLRLTKELS